MPTDAQLARLYAYPQDLGRTWVRSVFVSTIDGAAHDQTGTSGSLGGEPDHRVFQLLRTLADVIVVGAGTARAEGYEPVRPDEINGSLRRELGLEPLPPIAIVSERLDIPDALIVPGQYVITTESSPAERRAELGETMTVLVAGSERVDWPAVLDAFGVRGLRRLLCEGGPRLHGTLVAADLVDEICVTYAPVLAAGQAPRIAVSDDAVRRPMELRHAETVDGVLLSRWVRAQRD